MTVSGAVLVMMSLFVGEFAKVGWLAYPPLSGAAYSPGVGMDYYLWALQIAGVGTTLSGVNLIATIVKMRAPGMDLMKMPVFTWTALCTNVLIVATFPILAATLALLTLDRYVGTNFFTNDLGGNPMMYVNLIWIWGHPEVYILILPIFGIYSEVASTFCGKRLFGYASMVYATVVITILSYLVWLHHFFTMGSGASVNSFFGITTMIISIPTGAKIFNWLFTMYRGRIRFELPMMWLLAFMLTFVIGGMTGVMLAVPPADFVLHNSLFLIAHFHNVIIGGVVFGVFAGIAYWFPKAFGFKLDPVLGPAFLLVLGDRLLCRLHAALCARPDGRDAALEPLRGPVAADLVRGRGDGRRADRCSASSASSSRSASASCRREQLRDTTGDPWDGRTLEWSTSSPPPAYNFAFTPIVHDHRRLGRHEEAWLPAPARRLPADPHAPEHRRRRDHCRARHGLRLRLDLVHVWWLAALTFVGIVASAIINSFNYDRDFHIPADDVVREEEARSRQLGRA
jgi:cytochrome o ubiquinol oxidase subunit 1